MRTWLHLHAALVAARADAQEGDAVAVRGSMFAWILNTKPLNFSSAARRRARRGVARLRRRARARRSIEHGARRSCPDRRAEEHRRLLAREEGRRDRTRGWRPRTSSSCSRKLVVLVAEQFHRASGCRGP
jgi:hypothetical protein